MKTASIKQYIAYLMLLFSVICLSSCTTAPITGRSQLIMVPRSTMLSMGIQSYRDFLSKNPISTNKAETERLQRVGTRIVTAVEEYLTSVGKYELIEGYKWEFNLIESKEKNAWVMPGGKVVVYTGILPLTQNDAGLATVIGHEIAHAVANHGGERMTQALMVTLGGVALNEALKDEPNKTRNLYLAAYGAGTTIGYILPYSRQQEYEADEIGLTFMAMAGYDPNEAVSFWQRMAQQKQGGSVPEFLSTHPADESRIQHLRNLIPEAMRHYKTNSAPVYQRRTSPY